MANSYNLTLTVSPSPTPGVAFKGIYKDKDFKEILTTSDTYTETVYDGSVVDAFIRYRNNPVAVKLLKLTDGGTTVAYDVQLNSTTKNSLTLDTTMTLDDYVTDFDPDLTIKINKLQPSTSNGKTITLSYGGKEYDASDGKNTIKVPAASSITLTPSIKSSSDLSGKLADIQPGMLWVYNKDTNKYMFVTGPWVTEALGEEDDLKEKYPNPQETLVPLGIVVIPAGHAELQYPTIMALKPMVHTEDYEKGPVSKDLYMFGVPALSVSESTFSHDNLYDYVVTVDNTTREVNGLNSASNTAFVNMPCLPIVSKGANNLDDNTNFDPCLIDNGEFGTTNLGTGYSRIYGVYCPSPYDRNGDMNPKYYKQDSPSSKQNALSYITDWTQSLRTNTNGIVNNIADACLAYTAGGYTRKGYWMLPSISMLGYLSPRWYIISEILNECYEFWGEEYAIMPPDITNQESDTQITNPAITGTCWLSSTPRHYLADSTSDDLRFWCVRPDNGHLYYNEVTQNCIVYPFYTLTEKEVEDSTVIKYELIPYQKYQ